MEWETVIGLEVHVSLSTKSKLFSGSSTEFGADPNTLASIFDCALPGTLPVFNEEALRMASLYPAEFLGLGENRGRIATGFRADFALLDDDLMVTKTWIEGNDT